jgi:hypothetical protein
MRKSTVAALLTSAALALGCAGGVDVESKSSGAESTEVAAGNTDKKLSQPARDGKFEFLVTEISCGDTEVGKDFLAKKAQGVFCLVTLTVKNIGDKPQTMYSDAQHAYAGKLRFDADSSAGLALGGPGDVWMNEINPGNKVSGTIVFDVPKGTELTHLELHDSMFSGGVKVLNQA